MREEYLNGKVLLIDKPVGWTTFDVVNFIRVELKRKTDIPSIKIGHAGTLDPMANGLVIICTGLWTKRIEEFQNLDKEYVGQMILGAETPSYDMETYIINTYPTSHITSDLIIETADTFTGIIEHVPPIYSAVKIKGKRAYEYARKGINIKITPKKVQIYSFDIMHIEGNTITFRIHCEKGTYVRTIVNDFGKKLQSGAYLSMLRRTAIGEHLVVNALTPAQFSDNL